MAELAVLVPVLNRPQNVQPLVESFLAGCPDNSRIDFLVNQDDKDEIEAVVEAHCQDFFRIRFWLPAYERTWPEKINYGVENVPADWYLFAADDIAFTPGWWEATEELRNDPVIGVIGTNDSASGLGNPRVAAGEHTCHPLVRASYIREQGTIDEPGLAVHGGYSHWFVDDELVWTAKLRNAWAFCREAVIQHNHPYWDKSIPWDDTYAKGEENAKADMALWRDRGARLLGLTFQ